MCLTLDTRESALSWSRITPSVSSSCHLFLMDLRRFWIVSQYTSEVMVPLCSRNSTISDLGRRKRRWASPCLLIFQESGVFMIPKEKLKWNLHTQYFLLVSESFWISIRTPFLITQSLVNNCPHCSNADIQLLRQYSQCDMTVTSHKSPNLSMRSTVMTVFAWIDLESSAKLLQSARKQALHFFADFRTHSLTHERSPSRDE